MYNMRFSIALSALLAVSLQAQNISIKNYFYRDFLDMGQNKGVFAAGQNGIRLDSVKNPGVSISFDMPFLDQSARSSQGAATALGRNFAVTAHHVPSHSSAENRNYNTWGSTFYSKPQNESNKYSNDVKFLRYNKYIVEGNAELLKTNITGTTQTQGTDDSSVSESDKQKEQKNIQAIKEALKGFAGEDGKVIVFQAGQGDLTLREGEGGGFSQEGIKGLEGMRGGAFGEFDLNKLSYTNLKNERGPSFTYAPDKDMQNSLTTGDSGSGIFAYDSKNKKWVLLGVSSQVILQTWGRGSLVIQSDFDDYKNKFEQKIDLKNDKWTLDSSGITNGSWKGVQSDKDIIFQNGGTIEFTSNIDRNISGQVGGFAFEAAKDASASNITHYTIKSQNGKNYGFNGAGLDIAEHVNVNWQVGFLSSKTGKNDALHKVGKGTLTIQNLANSTAPSDNKYGYLRIGEGKVIFDTDKQAFQGVYITSGRATIELIKGKGGEAFGAVKDTNPIDSKFKNMFKLEQSHNENMGLTFGNGGGTLDLKGNSFTMNTIVSNDAKANIINTDKDTSYFVLEGYGYNHHVEGAEKGKKTQNKADTIIHASFGQSADSKQDVSNIVLMYSGNSKDKDSKDAHLVFDGNINAKGLEITDGNVTLQGHPTTHAYIRDKTLADKVAKAEGDKLPSWVDLSRPSTLEQPDWDHRTFKIKDIDLKGASLNLGREATLEAAIKADSGSKINFGGDIYHFADKKDGENVIADGFGSYQVVEKDKLKAETQKLANQSIHFKGSIEATGSEINSSIYDFNAKLDLKNGAKLKADYLTLDRETNKSGTIASLDNSSAEVKNLIFKGLSGNAADVISLKNSATFKFTESLGFESSTFDLSKLSSISGLEKPAHYDIFAKEHSSITGATTDITGNVGVMSGSSLSLQNITLKTLAQGGGVNSESSLKNSIIIDGDGSNLTASKIESEKQDNTSIYVIGASSSSTQSPIKNITGGASLKADNINLNGTQAQGVDSVCGEGKFGADCLASNTNLESKDTSSIYAMQGGKIDSNLKATNLKLNVVVDKNSSFLGSGKELSASSSSVALNFEAGKEQEFNINANSKSHIALTAWAGESYKDKNDELKKAIENSSFKGKITASDNSVVDSYLGNIAASVDLKNGAKLNIKEGGLLTLKDSLNSIALGANTALSAKTIIAEKLQNLTLNVDSSAAFNVENFVFKGGNISTSKYYGQNVWLQEGAQLTLAQGGEIGHNLYIDGKSTFSIQPNDLILESGKEIVIGGGSTLKADNGNGTLKIEGTGDTKIQTELGSKLELGTLLADKGSSVYVNLDLESANKPESPVDTKLASTQKNFSIEARGGSHIFVNSWDMNRAGFDNGDTSLKTDTDSRIHFEQLSYNMANKNHITSPIEANLGISKSLKLDNVGKAANAPFAQAPAVAGNSRDITSETAKTPTNQAFSESDPVKLAAQAGTADDRFHALKLQGNSTQGGVVQNDGKNLTLESGTRIDVNLDSSVNLEDADKNGFKLNKYYTLISAGSITDNREDKRIYFNFTSGTTPLYWVTIVEDGEVKVKFTKEDPSSYNELKGYIDNDKLLEILIQHNPKDDFVQMAGTANQHSELEGYLSKINSDMSDMAKSNSLSISDKLLNSNNQSINARIFQAKYARSRFSMSPLKLASNDDLGLAVKLLEDMKQKNNAWLSMGAGAFGSSDGDMLSFYSTNIGYDRLFALSESELVLGVMAGFGGLNYSATKVSESSMISSFGLYTHWQGGAHELQSNLSLSLINGDRSLQGTLGSEKAGADSQGMLSMSYYKYRFVLSENERYEHALKPLVLLSLGHNSLGAYKGANYAQQALSNTHVGLGAGLEYALSSESSSYALSLLARQNVYQSAKEMFISLSNAQNFMSYTLNPSAMTFELSFMGSTLFGRSFSLQYGLSAMADINGGYGGKGDVRFGYRF